MLLTVVFELAYTGRVCVGEQEAREHIAQLEDQLERLTSAAQQDSQQRSQQLALEAFLQDAIPRLVTSIREKEKDRQRQASKLLGDHHAAATSSTMTAISAATPARSHQTRTTFAAVLRGGDGALTVEVCAGCRLGCHE